MYGRKECDPINGCGKFYKQHLIECPYCKTPDAFSNFVPFNPLDWVYDLECYPNIFTASFKHMFTGSRRFFEVSDWKNDLEELYIFLAALKNTGCRMIGFNNIGYDYPLIHFIIEHYHLQPTVADIFNKSASIIATPWDHRFDNVIWDDDCHIQQIDLFKIHHFDNESRRISLKMLEFNMRSDSIEDLPYEPGIPLTAPQAPVLAHYNDHDVDETGNFYIESIEMIEFRELLGEKYGRNFLNHSDKKIGTDIFIAELEKDMPGSCYIRGAGRRQPRQTIRTSIHLADIIFPYIKFKERAFDLVKEFLQSMAITKTKGVLESLNVCPELAFMMDPDLIKVYGLTSIDVPTIATDKNLESKLKRGMLLSQTRGDLLNRNDLHRFKFISGWKDQSGLNCIIKGFKYDFGTGGIHGSIDSSIVYSNNDYVITDWDVGGYYPEVGTANNLYPEHLSDQFCVVNNKLKEQRKQYKKGTALNNSIKLSRNGAFGDSNSPYSPLYDPQYTMSITINGQLLLCMLAQYLIDIQGLEMIQINTDGLTVRCPRIHVETMNDICKWWEQYTCLELESAIYSRMFIRDVNNYIGEYEDGKLKSKGAYVHKTKQSQGFSWTSNDMDWHQNYSALIVPKAAEAALVHGVDIREFIINHNDIFDFMLRTKVKRSDGLLITDADGNEQSLQKITRYYISKTGGSLTKISPPAKGHKVGSWKRATKLTDQFYNSVIAELGDMTGSNLWHPDELDTTGRPWDERINTKNRSKYEIRRTGVNVGWLVSPCNNIHDASRSNINFEYYIAEAEKLVKPLLGVTP